MTNYQKLENEKYLNATLRMGKSWIWPDENATYSIENGFFIADTIREYELITKITTESFHEKIKLNSDMNF